MYLHAGEDILIQTKNIIVILDVECLNVSSLLNEFINKREKELIHITEGPFKSIIITQDQIFFSPLSTGTLKKRLST